MSENESLINHSVSNDQSSNNSTDFGLSYFMKQLNLNSLKDDPNETELNKVIKLSRIPLYPKKYKQHKEDNMTPVDLYTCLNHFLDCELMSGINRLSCDVCSKRNIVDGLQENKLIYQDTIKQDLIYKAPAILTVHLKRFEQVSLLFVLSRYYQNVK